MSTPHAPALPQVTLRLATDGDLAELARIFADAVSSIGHERYSEQQVCAWAASADDAPAFRRFVMDSETFVAERDAHVCGFAGLGNDGHITSLYVRRDCMRRGVGALLLEAVLRRAAELGIARLYTEASYFSRPLFERFGFALAEVEHVERFGVWFERYRMLRER